MQTLAKKGADRATSLADSSAIVQRGQENGGTRAAVELIELKCTELRLISGCGFSFNEPLEVLIADDDGGVTSLAVAASWVRPVDDERWLVRGRLKQELTADEQSRLSRILNLERRRFPRYPSNLPVTARWELTDDTFRARMLDVSVGGCRLQSPAKGEKGRRLVLEINGEERPMLARVQWCKEAGNGFQIGCEILSFLE